MSSGKGSASKLSVGTDPVDNFFQLLGYKEDSITLAIAWALANSQTFRAKVLEHVIGRSPADDNADIRVQRFEQDGGITDIEIVAPYNFHIVVEAKRGWTLPISEQLNKYAMRQSFAQHKARDKCLVSLSECTREYAQSHLPKEAVGSIPVFHISWKDLVSWARFARRSAPTREKGLLEDLASYLGIVMTSQRRDSNWVYVVSLGSRKPSGWKISWIDIVEQYSRYFHPMASGWPKEPPTYIGFRYHGKLQSIHCIEDYEVIDNLTNACPGIPDTPVDPHFLYTLGKAIKPAHEVKTGNVYPSGRVWCALDALLTCSSVSEARDVTQARLNQG